MPKSGKFTDEITALEKVLDALVPLDEEQQKFVYKTAGERLGLSGMEQAPAGIRPPGQGQDSPEAPEGGRASLKDRTPKQFLNDKKPSTDVERVVCLAYYLTHARDEAHFKTQSISKLNTEAALPKFTNAAYAVKNATRQNHYLAPAGGGKKQITSLGEEVVDALPARDAVKRAIDEAQKHRRKKRAAKSTKRTRKGSKQ